MQAGTIPKLVLPEPAAQLWPVFLKVMDEFFPTEGIAPRWSVGGGTILAADWDEHRRSTDVDGKIQLPAPGQTKTRLCDLARELAESTPEGGARTTLDAYVESYGGVLIPAPAGMEHMRTYGFPTGRIDLLEPEEPGLWPMEPVQIGQRVVFREATASILYGKLAGRGTDPPVRDPFDIAVAGEKAPSALDAAVRTAGSERMNAVLQVWQEKESEFSTWSLVDLQDVKPLWSDFREDPGYHGRRTLEEAMRRVGFQIEYRRMHRGGIP